MSLKLEEIRLEEWHNLLSFSSLIVMLCRVDEGLCDMRGGFSRKSSTLILEILGESVHLLLLAMLAIPSCAIECAVFSPMESQGSCSNSAGLLITSLEMG